MPKESISHELSSPNNVGPLPPPARASCPDEARGHIPLNSYYESGTRAAWNERYSTRGMVWGTDANQFVAAFAAHLSPRPVLDLGCGQGRNAVWLARQGHTVTGIDQSHVAIGQARRLAADNGVQVEFEVMDIVEDWTPPFEAFELVVLSYLQLPSEARKVAHAKAGSGSRPRRDDLPHRPSCRQPGTRCRGTPLPGGAVRGSRPGRGLRHV